MIAQITQAFINYLNSISEVVPLPLFTFIGSIIEEIVAPIPSPLVMFLAGSIAAVRHIPYIYLIFLALVGAVGKTAASYLIYLIADKSEDIVLTKFGKFLGVTHKEVEQIGRHLNKGWKDDVLLFVLRSTPIIPSAPISVVCGLIKLNIKTYLLTTFFGTVVRNLVFLGVSLAGISASESFMTNLENLEIVGYITLGILLLLVFGYIYFQRKKKVIMRKLLGEQDKDD